MTLLVLRVKCWTRFIACANRVLSKSTCPNKSFSPCKGKLLYISCCVESSRIFLNKLLALLHVHHTDNRIQLDYEACHSIYWSLCFMKAFNGVVTFRNMEIQHIYVDARLASLGGMWGSHLYSVPIPFDEIGYAAITQYEMYNVLLALRILARDLENRVVCIHCDNESVVAVIRSNKTRDRFLDLCLRNIWLICAM